MRHEARQVPSWLIFDVRQNMNSSDPWTSFQVAQIVSWSVAGLAGAITAWKAIVEMRRSREQAVRELRWRKAKEAKTVVEEITKHSGVSNALRMIDWDGRIYVFPEGHREPVTHEEMILALRLTGNYTHKEAYIRDCFDDFFDSVSRVEAMLDSGLIEFGDIRQFFAYYAARMRAHGEVFDNFISAYGFEAAAKFLKRFGDSASNSRVSAPKPLSVILIPPNKAPEPTTTSVTSPAAQELRQP
jgi:hypothetical protein